MSLFILLQSAGSLSEFLNDPFTGTNGDDLCTEHVGGVAGAWCLAEGSATAEIYNNRLRSSNATFGVWKSAALPASADYSVTATLHCLSSPGGFWGPIARCDHKGEYFYAAFYSGYLGGWALYKRSNGSFSQLGSTVSATLTNGVDYALTLDVNGTSIRLLVDGVEQLSVTDSSITASGQVGFTIDDGSASTTTGKHISSIVANQVASAPNFGTEVSFAVDGDSIFGDYARLGTPTVSMVLAAASRWNTGAHWNYAVGGQTVVQAASDAATQIDPLYALTSGYGKRLCVIMLGINDIIGSDTAATINTNIRAYHAARRSAGFATVGMTLLRAGSVGGLDEVKRLAVNTALSADTTFCDYFLDASAISQFSNTADTTYFVDGVHLTNVGIGILADAIVAAVPLGASAGKRSYLAHWMGGAGRPPVGTGGPRSPLAFWMGGAGMTPISSTEDIVDPMGASGFYGY